MFLKVKTIEKIIIKTNLFLSLPFYFITLTPAIEVPDFVIY